MREDQRQVRPGHGSGVPGGGEGAAEYLWQDKHIVPIVKVDKGLAEESQVT